MTSRGAIPAPTAPHRVEARGKGHSKRGGNRGRVVNKIHRTATERLQARAAGRSVLADSLTIELNGRDDEPNGGLYGELRDERKGNPGAPFRGRSASFVSRPTKPPKPWRGER